MRNSPPIAHRVECIDIESDVQPPVARNRLPGSMPDKARQYWLPFEENRGCDRTRGTDRDPADGQRCGPFDAS